MWPSLWRGKETKEKFVVPNFSNMAIRRFTAGKIPSQGFPPPTSWSAKYFNKCCFETKSTTWQWGKSERNCYRKMTLQIPLFCTLDNLETWSEWQTKWSWKIANFSISIDYSPLRKIFYWLLPTQNHPAERDALEAERKSGHRKQAAAAVVATLNSFDQRA